MYEAAMLCDTPHRVRSPGYTYVGSANGESHLKAQGSSLLAGGLANSVRRSMVQRAENMNDKAECDHEEVGNKSDARISCWAAKGDTPERLVRGVSRGLCSADPPTPFAARRIPDLMRHDASWPHRAEEITPANSVRQSTPIIVPLV